MTQIVQATPADAEGMSKMCSAAWRATYRDLFADDYISRVVAHYYDVERVTREISGPPTKAWGGPLVAKESGAIGGAVEGSAGQVWVLYLEPSRLRNGIGTRLLAALTEQWVSVEKRNAKGIAFYLAQGFKVRETKPRTPEGAQTLRLWRSLVDSFS